MPDVGLVPAGSFAADAVAALIGAAATLAAMGALLVAAAALAFTRVPRVRTLEPGSAGTVPHHVRKSTSLRVVQEALGHASLETTGVYVHLARELMDKELQQNAL